MNPSGTSKSAAHTAQHYDDALHVMELQGGSFVRALAACYYAADPRNKLRLKTAFADYFGEYEERFKRLSASPDQPTKGSA